MSEKDGGPAFPRLIERMDNLGNSIDMGMSLRDYFAAHAPITLDDIELWRDGDPRCQIIPTIERIQILANLRGEYADAMLAERNK